MIEAMNLAALATPIGVGATAILDLWALAQHRLAGAALPNYALVGRWMLYMPRGRFVHRPIADSPPLHGERIAGWSAHYLIGILFAAMLLMVFGADWARHPALLPALAVGIASLAAPFLLMQPGMGLGIAARRAARPGLARLRSLITHSAFGLGLYAAGCMIKAVRG